MNFDDTPQEAEFRATARKWIDANAPKQYEAELSKSSLGRIRLEKEEIVDVGKAWQKKKAEGGWACLHWPKEYGGRGATPIEKVIWQQEEGVYGKLTQPFQIGEGMCGPTVMAFGSEEHKRHYLPKLASGEHIWCQLFSEPAGGSDVAGLRTRAEKKGDNWIVNGQKIWTSGAHYSDYGLLITRTDPNVPKHKGPDDVLPRHEEQGRRGAADQAGQRHAGIQRGLFHRRRDSRSASASARSATAGTSR